MPSGFRILSAPAVRLIEQRAESRQLAMAGIEAQDGRWVVRLTHGAVIEGNSLDSLLDAMQSYR